MDKQPTEPSLDTESDRLRSEVAEQKNSLLEMQEKCFNLINEKTNLEDQFRNI